MDEETRDSHGLAQKAGFEDWGEDTGSDPPKRGLRVGLRDPGAPWGASAGREGRAVTRHIHAQACAHALSQGKPGSFLKGGHGVLTSGLRGTVLPKVDIVSGSTPRSVLSVSTTCPAGKERGQAHACLSHQALLLPLCQRPQNLCPNVCAKGTCVRPLGSGHKHPLPTPCSAHKCPLSRVCPGGENIWSVTVTCQ